MRAWVDAQLPAGVARGGEWQQRRDRDLYVDTADAALARAGFGARVRHRGDRWILTLKSQGDGTAALHRRIELEGEADAHLDPAAWPDSQARARLLELIDAEPLLPRFTIRQRRSVMPLSGDDGATAELSVDEVEVLRGRRTLGAFNEVEVEATGDGATGALLDRVAGALEGSGLVTEAPRSKEAAAAELLAAFESAEAGRRAFAALPKNPGVSADDTLAEAGRKVLRLHLQRMLALEAGTRSGEELEDLHKMRVATRRMRAAWRVFDGAYVRKVQKRYVAELRDVASSLGTVRDLDVQIDALEAYRARLSAAGSEAMEPLVSDWVGRRAEARARLMELLDSEDYAEFVSDYREFTETPRAAERIRAAGEPALVREAAGGRIWAAYERVRVRGAEINSSDIAAIHALRIDGKRLRYTLENFREALPRAQTDRLIASVTALQDRLGELNDADIAARTAREFLVAQGSRLPQGSREAIGHFIETREADVARMRRGLASLWRRVGGPTFRRSLASVIGSV